MFLAIFFRKFDKKTQDVTIRDETNRGILFKNRNFSQKSKFWSKLEILVKNRNFGKTRNFSQKSKFCGVM